jgi:hypothetical protein
MQALVSPVPSPPLVGTELRFDWWQALVRVLASIEAVRDGRAMYVLLSAFSGAGLAIATAQSSLAKSQVNWAVFQGALGLFIAFYGSNAAGLLLMDRALGRPSRDVMAAVEDALGVGHRVFITLAVMLSLGAAVGAGLLGLLWLCGLPVVGPWLFAAVVPLTVVAIGLVLMMGAAVVGPLTGPTVWGGASSRESIRTIWVFGRRHLLHAAVLMIALTGVTGLVGVGTSAVVLLGGRVMAEASVWMLGIDLQPEVLMVGLFGGGLHNIDASTVPKEAIKHTVAAAVGGGVVFAVALVLPTLVYLRGVCEVYLSLLQYGALSAQHAAGQSGAAPQGLAPVTAGQAGQP